MSKATKGPVPPDKAGILLLDLSFPHGLCAGAGAKRNHIEMSFDGQERPVLRGSSIAGVLRSAWRDMKGLPDSNPVVGKWFGAMAAKGDTPLESALTVEDAVLEVGQEKNAEPLERTFHQRHRHLGRVLKGGLYSVAACPPKTAARVALRVETSDKGEAEIAEFFREIAELFAKGLAFGGSSARGFGLAELKRAKVKLYDLAGLPGLADWLDDRRKHLEGNDEEIAAEALDVEMSPDPRRLEVAFTLAVPRGQDILVADGQGIDAESEPQRVLAADGREYWRLPGASLRGLFRSWYARLAAREGEPVADSHARHLEMQEKGEELAGDLLGWVFDQKNPQVHDEDPVARLFGSLHKKGRIWFSDGYCPVSADGQERQKRVHVSIDPLTGGAAEGLLFDDYVLTAPAEFEVKMVVEAPGAKDGEENNAEDGAKREKRFEDEARRLASALEALDLGLLRIGSSKSAGRVSLAGTPKAAGKFAHFFNRIQPRGSKVHEEILALPPCEPEPANCTSQGLGPQGDPASDDAKSKNSSAPAKPAEPPPQAGTLKKTKKGWIVELPAKKGGMAPLQIPREAKRFRDEDAEDGMEAHVTRDAQGRIAKVVLPGKEEAAPSGAAAKGKGGHSHAVPRVPPSELGPPFHNPYTFIPFAHEPSPRKAPTALTAEEDEKGRFTGILELEVETLSPLLARSAEAKEVGENKHKEFGPLAIGDDIIVPATSVRGFLRNLCMIANGDPVQRIEPGTRLCRGRDLGLGAFNAPVFLGRVVKPGSSRAPGKIELGDGEAPLVFFDDLQKAAKFPLKRPEAGKKPKTYWTNEILDAVSEEESPATPLQVKLSGRPVNSKSKKEGLFRSSGTVVDIPSGIWGAYESVNAHGMRPELKKGDLVWLESADKKAPNRAEDIVSIQWARWGKQGVPLAEGKSDDSKDALPLRVRPEEGEGVAMTTDLFGRVEIGKENAGRAGRVRPENLVFKGAKNRLVPVAPLAPLGQPHPGCQPFYLDAQGKFLGYKVYRTTNTDKDQPWPFSVQGICDDSGRIEEDHRQKMNFSAPLVPKGETGTLRISLRSLSEDELGAILALCRAPWRLGGGKPFGLGVCKATVKRLWKFNGESHDGEHFAAILPEDWPAPPDAVAKRLKTWTASQEPVAKLRYPRAAEENEKKISRGGHVWFQRFGESKKGANNPDRYKELQSVYVGKDGPEQEIPGQRLLKFKPDAPDADLLYGYDVYPQNPDKQKVEGVKGGKVTVFETIEPFDEAKHAKPRTGKGENTSPNRESRQAQRKSRGGEGGEHGRR